MPSASIVGSGPILALCASESSCASPTAGDGRWGSRGHEGGCSRRWSDQPSRPRLRMSTSIASSSSTLLRSTKLATVHSIVGVSLTMAVVCVRAAIRLDGRRGTSCACRPRWRRQTGGVMPCSRRGVRGMVPPLVVYGREYQGAFDAGIQYCHAEGGSPECRCSLFPRSIGGERHTPAPVHRTRRRRVVP